MMVLRHDDVVNHMIRKDKMHVAQWQSARLLPKRITSFGCYRFRTYHVPKLMFSFALSIWVVMVILCVVMSSNQQQTAQIKVASQYISKAYYHFTQRYILSDMKQHR